MKSTNWINNQAKEYGYYHGQKQSPIKKMILIIFIVRTEYWQKKFLSTKLPCIMSITLILFPRRVSVGVCTHICICVSWGWKGAKYHVQSERTYFILSLWKLQIIIESFLVPTSYSEDPKPSRSTIFYSPYSL